MADTEWWLPDVHVHIDFMTRHEVVTKIYPNHSLNYGFLLKNHTWKRPLVAKSGTTFSDFEGLEKVITRRTCTYKFYG